CFQNTDIFYKLQVRESCHNWFKCYEIKVLVATQTEVQHIIQDRIKELQELRHNVDVLKGNAQWAQTDSDKIFSEMLQAVERWHAEISQLIQANLQASMTQAQGYVERLEQEIMELQKGDAELRQILDTEDNIHFLQNFPTLSVAPEPMVPKLLINPEFSFSEITKTVSDMKEHLDDICKKELGGNLSKNVLSDTSVYILIPRSGGHLNVPIRTDLPEPKTRLDFLKCECIFYPDHPERFDGFCQILCKEPLSGMRHYWEVEWNGEFSIGVAYKSISRKGKNSNSLLGYNDKSWSLLCSDSGYSAWQTRASRIGVYLDYVRGSVSFYSVSTTMELIHRFKAKFSEALYAGFGVGLSVTLCTLEKNYRTYH
uniref:FinTRIM family, member 99 n=3 Tax=Cyprinus carpio TaxID=7962 RepID=A0A9R1SQB0_CYPCA